MSLSLDILFIFNVSVLFQLKLWKPDVVKISSEFFFFFHFSYGSNLFLISLFIFLASISSKLPAIFFFFFKINILYEMRGTFLKINLFPPVVVVALFSVTVAVLPLVFLVCMLASCKKCSAVGLTYLEFPYSFRLSVSPFLVGSFALV